MLAYQDAFVVDVNENLKRSTKCQKRALFSLLESRHDDAARRNGSHPLPAQWILTLFLTHETWYQTIIQ